MKKLATLLLLLALLLGLCPASLADTVYVPEEEFRQKHRDECVYEQRMYYINGPQGYAFGYTKPGGSGKGVFPNGQHYTVYWTYVDENGETWGCIEALEDQTFWVYMSDLLLDYDSESFVTDHAAEIEESAQIFMLERDKKLICWCYPGSGIVSDSTLHKKTEPEDIKITMLYKDSEGRQWGYCQHYIIKTENAWVCLDDPFNENLTPDENFVDVQAQLIPAADEATMEAALKGVKAPNYMLMFGAVGVVAIAAALLMYVLKKKKA